MSKTEPAILSDVNQLIIEKLRSYPETVSELAIRAIQLSEDLPEATVLETLHGLVRNATRKTGGQQ